MIILPLLLATVSPQAAAKSAPTPADRSGECGPTRPRGPSRAAATCEARALAARGDWKAAAMAFERAAGLPDPARRGDTPALWSGAGNAWLAGGEPAKAVAAFDEADKGALSSFERGELHLDRSRALVARGDPAAARAQIESALLLVPADPLAWLLSATLARRMADLPRARKDIAEALRRSPDDASVQLEAGNVAAAAGDEAGARGAWSEAARLGGDKPAGVQAKAALAQFATPAAP